MAGVTAFGLRSSGTTAAGGVDVVGCRGAEWDAAGPVERDHEVPAVGRPIGWTMSQQFECEPSLGRSPTKPGEGDPSPAARTSMMSQAASPPDRR